VGLHEKPAKQYNNGVLRVRDTGFGTIFTLNGKNALQGLKVVFFFSFFEDQVLSRVGFLATGGQGSGKGFGCSSECVTHLQLNSFVPLLLFVLLT
jgi:hypothetical protein